MPAPYHNLGSKADRAICAYLISKGVGTRKNINPANSRNTIIFPCIQVLCRRGTPNPLLVGNYEIDVMIKVLFSAVTDSQETNQEAARVACDLLLATAYDALMQADPGTEDLKATGRLITAAGRALATAISPGDPNLAANNADMVDFTVEEWHDAGWERAKPEDNECAWLEILYFKASCAPSNTD